VAAHVAHLPPVSTLFSALLGYNPMRTLLGPSGVLKKLPAHNVAVLTGNRFFPSLISGPFHHGLIIVFSAAIAMSVGGALISLLRGKQFYYDDAAATGKVTVPGLVPQPGAVAKPMPPLPPPDDAARPAGAAPPENGSHPASGVSPGPRREDAPDPHSA
jgi:hypothetical protein